MADADADAASDLAELIANAPEGDGAAPDAARAKQLREALKRAHDRALARSRAAAASAALLGDHRRGAQVSELVLGDAETVWQQLRLRGRDGDRHAVAAEHYLQRQAEAAEDDESDGDDEDDAAAEDADAADAESDAESASSSASSSEEEEDDAAEEEDEDEWANDEWGYSDKHRERVLAVRRARREAREAQGSACRRMQAQASAHEPAGWGRRTQTAATAGRG